MRRHVLLASSVLLGVGLLAGCGQKGPLFLPPPKPMVTAPMPAESVPPPAPAATAPTATPPARGG